MDILYTIFPLNLMNTAVAACGGNKNVRTKTVSRWRSRLANTITSFICSLQSTVSKKERDILIDNEMDYNERLVRQLYAIFQDFDQNGNGAISWAEFKLALEDERMHAFLNALELDMSDAVKVFQILASEKTGSIEESDFLLGCLRLRGGATTVDMVRMQMEQADFLIERRNLSNVVVECGIPV